MAKILVVDDDKSFLNTFGLILESNFKRREFCLVGDVRKAEEELEKGSVDVLISEWQVGGEDTSYLFKLASQGNIPRIMNTVYEPLQDASLRNLLNGDHGIKRLLTKGNFLEIKSILEGVTTGAERHS